MRTLELSDSAVSALYWLIAEFERAEDREAAEADAGVGELKEALA